MPRHFYIQTVGCQMNVLDSELVAAELRRAGYERADRVQRADIVLFNTCSVRQHAEDKIYSALGRLKPVKAERPAMLIGVLGCMAQKDRDEILRRAPYVDLVVGPGRLHQLPALLQRAAEGAGPCVDVSLDAGAGPHNVERLVTLPDRVHEPAESEAALAADARSAVARSFVSFCPPRTNLRSVPYQAMVRIMAGCDMRCTYCVVPRVRGPEQSRPASEIVAEVRQLVDQGCVEVTLLGQTVNGYRDRTGPRTVRLADLLERVSQVDGLRRLKFVTNHPRHMTSELLQAMRDLPVVSPYLHVPAQSGSDVVLRRMKRAYDSAMYREMLARIRELLPRAAVTSDFIVGFCGETEDDFQRTAELVRESRFKNSFIFKYSARPGTPAAELFKDDVPEAEKRRRNNALLAIQNVISLEDNQAYLGRSVEVLVEGPSKVAKKQTNAGRHRDAGAAGRTAQLVGRTVCDRIVVFDGPSNLTGRILPVTIERIDAFTLFGRLNEEGSGGVPS